MLQRLEVCHRGSNTSAEIEGPTQCTRHRRHVIINEEFTVLLFVPQLLFKQTLYVRYFRFQHIQDYNVFHREFILDYWTL